MKLLVSTVAPFLWVKLNKQGKPVEQGQFIEPAFFNTIPRSVHTIIGVAPADATTFHSVDIPTRKRSNMLAAVPYTLEESLSEEIDQLHFTVADWKPGQPAEVVIIASTLLEEWLETFTTHGVKLDAIIPEHSLLPIHPDSEATIVRDADSQYAIKMAHNSSFSCDQEAFEYWWSDEQHRQLSIAVNDQEFAAELIASGGESISQWAIGDDFRSWLTHAPAQLKSAPSLLHDAYEPEHLKPRSGWLNLAAALVLCSLAALGVSQWLEAENLKVRYEANQQAIRTLFDETFPGEEYLDQPRRQIASLLSISESEPADETFQYLLGLAVVATPETNAELGEINYRDQQLQIGVTVPNFAALEKLTTQIDAHEDIRAVLISSGSRDQRVTGQIKIAAGN